MPFNTREPRYPRTTSEVAGLACGWGKRGLPNLITNFLKDELENGTAFSIGVGQTPSYQTNNYNRAWEANKCASFSKNQDYLLQTHRTLVNPLIQVIVNGVQMIPSPRAPVRKRIDTFHRFRRESLTTRNGPLDQVSRLNLLI